MNDLILDALLADMAQEALLQEAEAAPAVSPAEAARMRRRLTRQLRRRRAGKAALRGIRATCVLLLVLTLGIVNAFITKNDQIDLFCLTSHYGLYDIKQIGCYVPLETSPELSSASMELYPVFKEALTDQGHLIGWIQDMQPWHWAVNTPEILEEEGCEYPQTFEQLLDVCDTLTDAGRTSALISLFDDYTYCKQDMMDLFMTLFIRDSMMNHGEVSFLEPAFLRIVKRIRDTLPDIGMIGEDSIFYTVVASFYPSVNMRLPPQTLERSRSAMASVISVIVINPYSDKKKEAIRFLEFMATRSSAVDYMIKQTMSKPVINPNNQRLLAEYRSQAALLEAKESLNQSEEEKLFSLHAMIAGIEANPWLISPDDMAVWQELVSHLYVLENSPITYDSSLQVLTKRYLAGAYTPEQFASACQKHVDMIAAEYGMEVPERK